MTAFGTTTERKALFSSILLASSIFSGTAMAAEQDLATAIERVKLYRNDGAVVYRSGTITLPRGTHTLTIRNLPEDIDEDYAIRAVLPVGTGTVSRVELSTHYDNAATSKAQKELEDKINAIRESIEADKAASDAIDLELSFLGKISGENAPANQETLSFISSNAGRLTDKKRQLTRSINSKGQEIYALDRQLRETGSLRTATTTAVVTVIKNTNESIPLDFSYFTADVSVGFKMDAIVDSNNQTASVSLNAVISQESGENWNNVPLVLTSSNIHYSLGIDQPASVYQNLSDPTMKRSFSLQSAPPRRQRDVEEVVVTGTKIQRATFETELTPKDAVSINSDGSEQVIPLLTETLPLDLKVRISPKFSETAYLFGNATFTKLPAIVSPLVTVVRDGQFLGSGTWPDIEPNQVMELPLGYVEQINTVKTKLPSEDGESGIFGRSKVDESKMRYTVTNNLNGDYTIEVFDVKPQSMNEDLDITVLRGSTRYTEEDVQGKPGLVVWRKTLKPGEEWTINHWLRTKYPSGKTLIREHR